MEPLNPTPVAETAVRHTVNDFSLTVATANGTGSQTSNLVLLRTFFNMGIPVTGKNIFPSNIQGLPTWYSIRLSKDGYLARREGIEILVCMNPATAADDMAEMQSSGFVLYDDAIPLAVRRDDLTYVELPVRDIVKSFNVATALRSYVGNMVYVGALAWLLDIPMDEIRRTLEWQLKGKAKVADLNFNVIQGAFDWCQEHHVNTAPFRVARMEGFNEGKILVEGNEAAALGCVFGGVSLVSWYPITPSSSLAEYLLGALPQYRLDPDTGKPTFAVIQAEDELAAIGMAIGANWAGARGMTTTSGPGISLMSEFIGLAYFAEIPVVVWDIQRMGPSTGLPTRTSQGDILSAYTLSHGDTKHVVLFPATPQECFEFGHAAFDIADRLQAPVLVLSDLDLGMNLWISEPFAYPDQPIDRGKRLSAAEVEELASEWGRYRDVDGDGIGYRTVPGTPSQWAGYFTRGTGHDESSRYSEKPHDWEANLSRIQRKFETARSIVPAPEVVQDHGCACGLISIGSNHPAIEEARDRLRRRNIDVDYLRIRALPTNETVSDFIQSHDLCLVIENNADGQLHGILQWEVDVPARQLVSVRLCNGLALTAHWIVEQVLHHRQG